MNASSLAWIRAALLALFVVAAAQPAGGHGVLLESVPGAGETVEVVKRLDLRFNNRLEPRFSWVRLTGPSGERVALAAGPSEATAPDRMVVALPPLASGPHTVYWRVYTLDGHLTKGSFSFRVAERRGQS